MTETYQGTTVTVVRDAKQRDLSFDGASFYGQSTNMVLLAQRRP